MSPVFVATVKALLDKGRSRDQIATNLGRTQAEVDAVLSHLALVASVTPSPTAKPHRNKGFCLNDEEIAIVKGLVARGEKKHDIAGYFGINAGRIADITYGRKGAHVKAAYPIDLPKLICGKDIRKDCEQRLESAGKVMRELAMEVAALKKHNKELQNTIDRMVDAERVERLKASHAEMEKAKALYAELGFTSDPFN